MTRLVRRLVEPLNWPLVASRPGAGRVPTGVPVETSPPTISPPTAAVSDVLTGVHGQYTNFPDSYTYRWLNNAVAIPGETAITYTVQSGDVGDDITFEETPSNVAFGAGSASTSAPVVPTGGAAQLYPPSGILDIGQDRDFMLLKAGGGAGGSEALLVQGAGANLTTRRIMEMRDTSLIVSMFDLDGPSRQAAMASSTFTGLGHSGFAVEQGASNYCWGQDTAAESTTVLRGLFVAGGTFSGIEARVIFGDITGETGVVTVIPADPTNTSIYFCHQIISATNQGKIRVREYNMAAMIAAGAGDFTPGQPLAAGVWIQDWIQPDAAFGTNSTIPFQAAACDRDNITFFLGYGQQQSSLIRAGTYTVGGVLVQRNDAIPYTGYPFQTTDAVDGTKLEPEALFYYNTLADTATLIPALVVSSGGGNQFVRALRADGLGVSQFTAASYTARWVTAMTAAGATPSAGAEAAMLQLYTDLISAGLHKYLGHLHLMRAEAKAHALTNAMHPGVLTLTEQSTIASTFTAKAGWAGTGNALQFLQLDFLSRLCGFGQSVCNIGLYTYSNSAESTAAAAEGPITTTGSNNAMLKPRNGSDQTVGGLNSVDSTRTSAMTTPAGLWTVNRSATGSYVIRQNGAVITDGTVTAASASPSGSKSLAFLGDCDLQYQAFWAGYGLTTGLEGSLKTALETYFTAIAALP